MDCRKGEGLVCMMTIPFENQEKSTIAKNHTQSWVNLRYIAFAWQFKLPTKFTSLNSTGYGRWIRLEKIIKLTR
jgi:hypothetical protein